MVMSKHKNYSGGEFRHPVQVQSVAYTPDGAGGQVTVWSNAFLIYCALRSTSSTEVYSDGSIGRVRSKDTWEFVTWFRSDITTQHRLKYKNQAYNISDVDDLNQNGKFLKIVATTGVGQ